MKYITIVCLLLVGSLSGCTEPELVEEDVALAQVWVNTNFPEATNILYTSTRAESSTDGMGTYVSFNLNGNFYRYKLHNDGSVELSEQKEKWGTWN